MKKVLLVCKGNNCRSKMAKAYLSHFAGTNAIVYSAGVEPMPLDNNAVSVMMEDGIDISADQSAHINDYANETFDYIITLCYTAKESMPDDLYKGAKKFHYNFPDPAEAGNHDDIKRQYKVLRQMIRTYCEYFAREYCS
jgi:arsenate reductase